MNGSVNWLCGRYTAAGCAGFEVAALRVGDDADHRQPATLIAVVSAPRAMRLPIGSCPGHSRSARVWLTIDDARAVARVAERDVAAAQRRMPMRREIAGRDGRELRRRALGARNARRAFDAIAAAPALPPVKGTGKTIAGSCRDRILLQPLRTAASRSAPAPRRRTAPAAVARRPSRGCVAVKPRSTARSRAKLVSMKSSADQQHERERDFADDQHASAYACVRFRCGRRP